jgi:hypothetical protein
VVDPYDVLGVPGESLAIYGTRFWDRLGPGDVQDLRRRAAAWQFSQFLHGEQGAMICRPGSSSPSPDIDAKFYATSRVSARIS